MNGWEQAKVGSAIVLACGTAASAWWISGELMAPVYPRQHGYAIEGVAPVDLAAAQREWPMGAPAAEREQLLGYIRDIEHAAVPTAAEAAAGPAVPAPSLDVLLASADSERGKRTAQVCMACHDLSRDGANRIGPALWGVVGRPVASHAGFAYSSAMQQHGGAWNYAALDRFLARPSEAVPGTKMTFSGLRNPRERANVLAFLASLGSAGPPR